jgi:hypothetical protein
MDMLTDLLVAVVDRIGEKLDSHPRRRGHRRFVRRFRAAEPFLPARRDGGVCARRIGEKTTVWLIVFTAAVFGTQALDPLPV